jgi:mannose-6-phosphate isomerase
MKQPGNKVFRLIGDIQQYAWGGKSFLPRLLHLPNPESKPFAEYWMGAHDNASSVIVLSAGETVKLNKFIRNFPVETLGEKVEK